MKKILISLIIISVGCHTFAQDTKEHKRDNIKKHVAAHLKPYGFVRNYFSYDTRECVAGTGDLYNYLPKDNLWNQTVEQAEQSGIEREDLNAVQSFRFLSLTTRLGLNIVDYQIGNTQFGGKIEADFYAGLTGVTGTAQFRLRQAYMTLAWDSLRMGNKERYARIDLLLGQAWHPMAADLADVIALNSGAPFGPFSRTPQIKMDARLADWFSLTAAAIWQMQYTSVGPEGKSANYIKYARTPEAYIGLGFMHKKDFLFRVGLDVLSISPRHIGMITAPDGTEVKVKVNDRLTTFSPFAYLQYQTDYFKLQAKTIFAEGGEHMNLNGGYGVSRINTDGSWEYTPTRNSTTWICMSFGKQIKGILFAGYVRNFGTKKPLVSTDKEYFYFSTTSFNTLNRAFRVSPTLLWTIGKFQLGIEYEITSAQYGSSDSLSTTNGLAESNLHWVTNHKIQAMTKFNF